MQTERFRSLMAAAIVAALPASGYARSMMSSSANPIVGGSEMYPTRNIIENAVTSKDHTTLVTAVKATGLVQTLEGSGPFTVFAPTNEAFAALPAGTVDTLLKPENKAELTNILTYHVVSGNYDTADLKSLIERDGGKAELPSVTGPDLIFTMGGDGAVEVTDAKGNTAEITIADVSQSNGVIQVINKVLLP